MRFRTLLALIFLSCLLQACGNYSLTATLQVPGASAVTTPAQVTLPPLTATDEPPAQATLQMATSAPWVQLQGIDE